MCSELDSVYMEEDEFNSSSIFPVCKQQNVNTSLSDSDILQKVSQTGDLKLLSEAAKGDSSQVNSLETSLLSVASPHHWELLFRSLLMWEQNRNGKDHSRE